MACSAAHKKAAQIYDSNVQTKQLTKFRDFSLIATLMKIMIVSISRYAMGMCNGNEKHTQTLEHNTHAED